MNDDERDRYEKVIAGVRNGLEKSGFPLTEREPEPLHEFDGVTEEVAIWGKNLKIAVWMGRFWDENLHFWFGFQGRNRYVEELYELIYNYYDISVWDTDTFIIGDDKDGLIKEIYNKCNISFIGKYETGFIFESDDELISQVLDFICAIVNDVDPLSEIDIAELKSKRIPQTERLALISARRGQGQFRRALEEVWGCRCAVTGCNIKEALRASHIQPWNESSDTERLDPNNGLLLTATLDALFDKYLISFEDNGRILVAPNISAADRNLLVLDGLEITAPLSAEQRRYLASHRRRFRLR